MVQAGTEKMPKSDDALAAFTDVAQWRFVLLQARK
jgi:hypothetical protein